VLDQLEPDKDVENFVQEYGTGNSIPDPPVFVPYPGQQPDSSPSNSKPTLGTRPANFVRASARPAPAYQTDQDAVAQSPPEPQPPRSTERADSQSDAGSTRGEYQDRGLVDPAVARAPNGTHVVNNSVSNGNVTSAPKPTQPQQAPPSTWQPEPELPPRRLSAPLPPQPPQQTPYQDNPTNRAPTPPPDEGGRILFYGMYPLVHLTYELAR
jgi:hypothetical protein